MKKPGTKKDSEVPPMESENLTKDEAMTVEEQAFLAGSLAGYRAAKGVTQTPRRANEGDEQEPPKKDWTKIKKTCPKCEKSKFVDPGFGVRVVRGRVGWQSWCKECRANTNYYNRERKYGKR